MAFKVEEHLMQLQGKDYLEVKWRLVWFRQECPNGSIETEVVHLDLDKEVEAEVMVWNNDTRRREKVVKRAKGYCVFHAVVRDGKGGVGSGTKSESAVDFGDFIEKAESGAIGRALATLGYGTQFTGDELSEHHRIVDSPVDRAGTAPDPLSPATAEQMDKIRKLSEQLNRPLKAEWRPNYSQAHNVLTMLEKEAQKAEVKS